MVQPMEDSEARYSIHILSILFILSRSEAT